MTVPDHRDDVPAADAAEQDRPADPTAVEFPAGGDIPSDADPADVLDQRADAAPDEDDWND